MRAPIITLESIATFLPKRSMTNDDLVALGVDTTDEWVQQRTGIRSRHMADETETTAMMGLAAAREALDKAKLKPEELDGILVATCSPSLIFPSVATQIQGGLGVKHGFAMDIAAACSGFIYGLQLMDSMFRGQDKLNNALLIGVDSISRLLGWETRGTAVLFGDGAGAVVVRRTTALGIAAGGAGIGARGILACSVHSDGSYVDNLYTSGGAGSHDRERGVVYMDGPLVFKVAVEKLSSVIGEVVAEAGIELSDIDWFVPHQANERILAAVGKRMGLDESKVVMTVDHHGNTSAASVPLAFGEAVGDGRIKKGDLVLMEAMGAGFTWGAALVRW